MTTISTELLLMQLDVVENPSTLEDVRSIAEILMADTDPTDVIRDLVSTCCAFAVLLGRETGRPPHELVRNIGGEDS